MIPCPDTTAGEATTRALLGEKRRRSIGRDSWEKVPPTCPESGDDLSPDGIIAAMRQVYGNQPEARQKGQASASRANLFTWKASGKKLIAALRKHGYLEGK